VIDRLANAGPSGSPEDRETVLGRARDRALHLTVLVWMSYLLLLLRAVPLMLMPDDRLEAKAALQFHEAVEIQAPRGDLLARDGAPLATSVEMPALHANP